MTNNKKVNQLLNGFTSLSNDERNLFIEEINKFNRFGLSDQRNFSDRLKKSLNEDLGPTGDGFCACCGKG